MSVTTQTPTRRFRIERLEERIAPCGLGQLFTCFTQLLSSCEGGGHEASAPVCGTGGHGNKGGPTPPPPPSHGSHGGCTPPPPPSHGSHGGCTPPPPPSHGSQGGHAPVCATPPPPSHGGCGGGLFGGFGGGW